MALASPIKQQTIQDYSRKEGDTGSPEVQIALLTGRISQMTGHMKAHTKDFASRRGLLRMVSRRRRLLDYVKSKNPQLYLDLLQRLGIRK